eukprot:UN22478
MKIAVKTGTDSLVGKRLLIAAESREKIEEEKNLETIEIRLTTMAEQRGINNDENDVKNVANTQKHCCLCI